MAMLCFYIDTAVHSARLAAMHHGMHEQIMQFLLATTARGLSVLTPSAEDTASGFLRLCHDSATPKKSQDKLGGS
jgi:hypothetical protein